MATVSFTRSMRLNKQESKRLLDIVESKRKVNFKVTTPPAEETSRKTLEKIFGDK